jgi:acylphosphatase
LALGPVEKRVGLRIKGRVQGVFYRESARRTALSLGVKGWVRNLRDGDVEAVAQGESAAVDAFVAWCRKGPPSAAVVDVLVTEGPPASDFTTFSVER